MAKKSSSNQPVTKKDIERVEESLRKFATKADFRNLRSELLKVEVRAENIEEKVEKVDEKLDRIENKLDGFVGTIGALREENAAGSIQYRRHEKRLQNHEERITALESATQ